MIALDNFFRYSCCAYLMNLQWLMCNVILRMIMSDFKLSLTFLLIRSQGKNSMLLVIDSLLQFLYLYLLLFQS